MSKCYVLMAETTSPVAFNVPSPVAVYKLRIEALKAAHYKNENAKRLRYFVQPADDQMTRIPKR